VEQKIAEVSLAATFIKNPHYELAKRTDEKLQPIKSKFDMDALSSQLPSLVSSLYKEDKFENGKVNSCEFFLEKIETRIMNSSGVDESYTSYKGQIEMVVDWKETGEEIELIEIIDFSDLNTKAIEDTVLQTLENAQLRAKSAPMPKLDGVPVLLVKENVNEFLSYYINHANAMLVYQKYSSAKIGERTQGENVTGDKINARLLPEIENSVSSKYIDGDGVKLFETSLYKDGELIRYHGNNRYSQYLGMEPTGAIGNVRFEGGKNGLDELKKGPYLELRYFSDFQMDEWTGDFGGEIRLGVYFDGEKHIPVTGGSISGNIKEVQESMLMSSELQTSNNYVAPAAIKLFGMRVAG